MIPDARVIIRALMLSNLNVLLIFHSSLYLNIGIDLEYHQIVKIVLRNEH